MTDLFKCKKSGTQCCAPKTKIQEKQDSMGVNSSMPIDLGMGIQQGQPSQYMGVGGGTGSISNAGIGGINGMNHGLIGGEMNGLRTPYTPATVGKSYICSRMYRLH